MSASSTMPVLFLGHGNPMNAIEDNIFSRSWQALAGRLAVPKAILCISAHWETRGTFVTAMPSPRTIHDFGGFPRALFEVQYPAPGSPELAREILSLLEPIPAGLDQSWGLDHGTWSVVRPMYPGAEIPVVQLSLDATQPPQYHYDLARRLAGLREQDILIIGSGNMVHNLGRIVLRSGSFEDFNQPFGLPWAIEANDQFKKLIDTQDHAPLIDYPSLGPSVRLAVPTPEHYLPLLYILALQKQGEPHEYFNDQAVGGSLTMTSILFGGGAV